MPRRYIVSFENVSITSVQDLLSVKCGTKNICRLIRVKLGALQTSALIPAQQMLTLRCRLFKGAPTQGSAGSSITTPPPIDPGDSAASFTARSNDTTQTSGGTATIMHEAGVHIYAGEDFSFPSPPVAGPGEILTYELILALSAAVAFSGEMEIEEWGG